jgi:hypothetical protein
MQIVKIGEMKERLFADGIPESECNLSPGFRRGNVCPEVSNATDVI